MTKTKSTAVESKHTETPWNVHATYRDEVWAEDTHICEVHEKGDAAHIVRCVNAHDDMLAALEKVTDKKYADWDEWPSWLIEEIMEIARAALAKAKREDQ